MSACQTPRRGHIGSARLAATPWSVTVLFISHNISLTFVRTERNHNIRIPGFASDETRISISQSAITPAPGAAGSSSNKKNAQNANVTLRSQRLAQVAQAKKDAKLM